MAAICSAVIAVALVGCGETSHPAATVNGQQISMADYSRWFAYTCSQAADSFQGADICGSGKSDPSGLRHKMQTTALNTLIDEELVRQYAAKHHISIPSSQLNAQWQTVYLSKFHRDMPYLKAYAKARGLTANDIKNLVFFDMLQQRVLYDVTKNMPVRVPATHIAQVAATSLQDAQQIRARIAHGAPFMQVARLEAANSKSPCAQVGCGDLGWLPDAFLPAAEKQVATSPANSLVGPFPIQNGAILILVEQHDPAYLLNAKQQYAMRQQVIFPHWLAQQERKADVHRYVAT